MIDTNQYDPADNRTEDGQSLWIPKIKSMDKLNIKQFINFYPSIPGLSYNILHQWSITHLEDFWRRVWDFCGAIGEQGNRPWLINWDLNQCVPNISKESNLMESRFFPNSTFNGCQNIMRL